MGDEGPVVGPLPADTPERIPGGVVGVDGGDAVGPPVDASEGASDPCGLDAVLGVEPDPEPPVAQALGPRQKCVGEGREDEQDDDDGDTDAPNRGADHRGARGEFGGGGIVGIEGEAAFGAGGGRPVDPGEVVAATATEAGPRGGQRRGAVRAEGEKGVEVGSAAVGAYDGRPLGMWWIGAGHRPGSYARMSRAGILFPHAV